VASPVDTGSAGARARRRPPIDLRAFQELTDLADYFVPFTIRTISELGIADLLADGPLPVEELAARSGTQPGPLLRALRALAGRGVFAEVSERTFGLTPMAEVLRSDHPLSMADAYRHMPEDVAAWLHLAYSLRTGRPAFDHVHGQHLWDYLAGHPEAGQRFDRGMQAMTRPELLAAAGAYDWRALGTVVDVGGGNGTFLAGLLTRYRTLSGVLLDLPHVVAGAPPVLAGAGVADRCEVVAGSFFEAVPPGAGGYLLKRIVYGWDDQGAVALLGRVREAMAPSSRVLVMEPVDRPGGRDQLSRVLDLVMLVVDGGRARTPAELEALFTAAGLQLTRVIDTMAFPIVEGRRAP
jgi:hypothetical protein